MTCNCDGPEPDSVAAGGPINIAMTVDQVEALRSNPSAASLFAGNVPLIDHGGRKIATGGRIFNIYMSTTMPFDTNDFDAFTEAIAENGYLRLPGGEPVTVTFLGSTKVPWPFASNSVSDTDLANWLAAHVGRDAIPGADDLTQFSMIMPAGTTVSITMNGQTQRSCSAFCGYHVRNTLYYQIIADSSCPGCHGGFATNDGCMMIQAHELAEWVTDPNGDGWYDANGWENADKCAWQRVSWGPAGKNWCVQPFAMKDGSCFAGPYVPPSAPPPPPAPKTVALKLLSQPKDAVVGVKTPSYAVACLLADGSVNVNDMTTLVFSKIPGFTLNDKQGVATEGIVTFQGDTFMAPHAMLWYNISAMGLPLVMSDMFNVAAQPTPPPPPPPPPPPSGPKEVLTIHFYDDFSITTERKTDDSST